MYKFLLTKLDQDVYEVFAYFFENAEEYESISDLANKLSVSKRRIVLVIDRALDLRERYPFYDIEIIDGRTISLRFASNFLLSKLYSVMLEESMPFQILDRLFREKYLSLENTAQQHFVSNRTVQRKLKEIMDILENYNISLNLKRKPLFVGEEYRIRHFFSYHVLANFGWLKCTLFWPDSKKYYWFQRKTRDVSKLLPRNRSRKVYPITGFKSLSFKERICFERNSTGNDRNMPSHYSF
ncbi:helix-turn-helix domain-containing protein [Enterococcus gallinarum]|uniref:helix-turn-helix domain-containing protein n=1 Tax=Enterococcus gallinarum TaxID=1353 RepID=UPI001DFA436A|nr:helix-turn-helix domain-containing protein [Enterococcus gallinarum]